MKTSSIVRIASILFVVASTISQAGASQYKIDPVHSSVDFSIRHLVSKVNGRFKDFEGTFSFDEKKADLKDVKFSIKTASINTDNEKRDGHLKSGDFFDVEKFPEMTFASTKITAAGKGKFKVDGNVTMHGVTKPTVFMVEFMGAVKNPMGEGMKTGFSATTKLNRKDFGIIWNKALDKGELMLGEDVSVSVGVEAQSM